MTPEQSERLRTLWKAGTKAEAIAAELGVSYRTLVKNRRKLGLIPRTHFCGVVGSLPTLSVREALLALELWAKGRDTAQIASSLGTIESAVYNSIRARMA